MVFKENGAGPVASERVLRMDYRQGDHWNATKP